MHPGRPFLALALACSVAAGCSSGEQPAAPGTVVPPDSTAQAETDADVEADAATYPVLDTPECLPDATAFAGGTQDAPTSVAVLGAGDRGVVMAPQSTGDWCQWEQEATRLVAAGYHVATFSWGLDSAQSMRDAVEVLQSRGVTQVALVGASKGGGVAAGVAGELEPAAVIALSPINALEGLPVMAVDSTYTGPLLVVASIDDGLTPAEESRTVARDDSTYLEVPGSAHGVAMLDTDAGPQVREAIDALLADAFTG